MGATEPPTGSSSVPITVGPRVIRREPAFHAFEAGNLIYLSFKCGLSDTSVPATCVGVQPESSIVVVHWHDTSSSAALEPGLELTCQTIKHGVLYILHGQLAEIAPGRSPRLKLRVEPSCVALPLRRYQRYKVQGRLRLGPEDGAQTYAQNAYHAMNISLRGFGIELPSGTWQVAGEVPFALGLLVERNGTAMTSLPGLEIEGRAVVRKQLEAADGATVYLGLEFTELAESQQSALQFWLTAHQTYLREE